MRLLLIFIALLLAGCRDEITYRVLVVGDSLAVYAQPALSQALLPSDVVGFKLTNNPIGGATFANPAARPEYWINRGEALLADGAVDAVFVSFGTNDALLNADPAKRVALVDMRAAAARVMAMYGASSRPVFWLLPHTLAPDNWRQEVVLAIRLAAADYPQVRIIDLEVEAAARGITFGGLLQPDGVHFNDQGNALLADVVLIALTADARTRGLD